MAGKRLRWGTWGDDDGLAGGGARGRVPEEVGEGRPVARHEVLAHEPLAGEGVRAPVGGRGAGQGAVRALALVLLHAPHGQHHAAPLVRARHHRRRRERSSARLRMDPAPPQPPTASQPTTAAQGSPQRQVADGPCTPTGASQSRHHKGHHRAQESLQNPGYVTAA